jgi:hypothetical protein
MAFTYWSDGLPAAPVTGGDGTGGLAFWGDGLPADLFILSVVSVELGLASEVDTAFSLTPIRTYALGLASETDTAFGITAAKSVALGLATETDTAFELRPVKVVTLGLAIETDFAFDVVPVKADIVTGIPLQRWLVRTAQFDQLGECSVEDFRISIKRGIGDNSDESHIRFRFNRDNKGFGKWIRRGLGKAGDRFSTINIGPLGTAHVWQFEVACDDDCDVELQGMEAIIKRIGH